MKHKDIARAWLDGKTIEFRQIKMPDWLELSHVDTVGTFPSFYDDMEYRIKQKPIKYRIALIDYPEMRDIQIVYECTGYKIPENAKFIKWITGILEFDLTE